jgi:hypothetical protein
MLKGDLIKREDVWHVIYSAENSGRINEIPVTDYSAKRISEKRGDKIKFFSGVNFEILDGKAAIKLVPNYPPKKVVKEEEKPYFVSPKLDKPFSKEEEEIMKLITEADTKFYQLENISPSDESDWMFHLRGMQRIMAQRVLRRDYPNIL